MLIDNYLPAIPCARATRLACTLTIIRAAIQSGALIVLYFILAAREWVVLTGTTEDSLRYDGFDGVLDLQTRRSCCYIAI